MRRFQWVLLGFVLLAMAWPASARAEDVPKAEVFVRMGHLGNVLSLAVSPDGQWILSGGRDNALVLWDRSMGREIRRLAGPLAAVNAVCFLPDGHRALSAGSDPFVRLWDLDRGVQVGLMPGHMSGILAAAVAPDGTWAATAGMDKLIKIWDLKEQKEIRTLSGHGDSVGSLAVSPDGRWLLSGSADHGLRVWNAATGQAVRTLTGHGGEVSALAFFPDGRTAVSAGWDGRILWWNIETGQLLRSVQAEGPVLGVAVTKDGGRLITAHLDKTVGVWDASSGLRIKRLEGHKDQVTRVAAGPDGTWAVSGSWDGSLREWDLVHGREAKTFKGFGLEVDAVAVGPDGHRGLTGGSRGPAMVWDLESGRGLGVLETEREGVGAVSILPDGRRGLAAGSDGRITLWDLDERTPIRVWKAHEGPIDALAVSLDGRRALSGGLDEAARLWDLDTGSLVHEYPGFGFRAAPLALHPDGKRAAGPKGDGISLWDLETGAEIRRLAGHGPGVESLTFSPDGRTLLSTSFDRTLKLWDIETGREQTTLAGHIDSVEAGAFQPGGTQVLSASWDRTLRLWDPGTGQVVQTLAGHGGWVQTAAFRPDGRRILSGGADGAALWWDTAAGRELARFFPLENGEWVVITPEGYYAASALGHQAVSVRLGTRVYGIDQFYDVFYRPDIVEHKLRGNDIAPLIRVTLEQALKNPPPAARVLSGPSETDQDRAVYRFRVENQGGGIGEVRVFHNGKLIQTDGALGARPPDQTAPQDLTEVNGRTLYAQETARPAAPGALALPVKGNVEEFQVEVRLLPGENEIGLTAFNGPGNVQGPLVWTQTQCRQPVRPPSLHILAVGVNRYKTPKADLKFAAKDAADMAARLAESGRDLFPSDRIHLTLLQDDQATRAGILGALDHLAETAMPQDTTVVFFAGHGVLWGDQYHFVTHDYAGRLGEDCLIGSTGLVAASTRIRALSQVFILDSCHAGGVDYVIGGLYDARMAVMAKRLGLHLFGACASYQSALDGYQGNGLFTHFLLEGLGKTDQADRDGDRTVSVVELGRYTRRETEAASRRLGPRQSPSILHFGRDIPLSHRP